MAIIQPKVSLCIRWNFEKHFCTSRFIEIIRSMEWCCHVRLWGRRWKQLESSNLSFASGKLRVLPKVIMTRKVERHHTCALIKVWGRYELSMVRCWSANGMMLAWRKSLKISDINNVGKLRKSLIFFWFFNFWNYSLFAKCLFVCPLRFVINVLCVFWLVWSEHLSWNFRNKMSWILLGICYMGPCIWIHSRVTGCRN